MNFSKWQTQRGGNRLSGSDDTNCDFLVCCQGRTTTWRHTTWRSYFLISVRFDHARRLASAFSLFITHDKKRPWRWMASMFSRRIHICIICIAASCDAKLLIPRRLFLFPISPVFKRGKRPLYGFWKGRPFCVETWSGGSLKAEQKTCISLVSGKESGRTGWLQAT